MRWSFEGSWAKFLAAALKRSTVSLSYLGVTKIAPIRSALTRNSDA